MVSKQSSTELLDKRARIALVSMPFASHYTPSIGLSLLKAALAAHSVPADVLYLNLAFGEWCEPELYQALSLGYPNNTELVGEWIFAGALYNESQETEASFIETILLGRQAGEIEPAGSEIGGDGLLSTGQVQRLLELRRKTPAFLEWCLRTHDWGRYSVVGFTSMFQQQLASLALAHLIKQRYPYTTIVFGGANCEGVMGKCLFDNFQFVEAVCSGEGDLIAPRLLADLANDVRIPNLPGVFYRQYDCCAGLTPKSELFSSLVTQMDALPIPDYDEYFAAFRAASFRKLHGPQVLFETSRGCWWGDRSHCTFCGLNRVTMAFRAKSATRAVKELRRLRDRYGHLAERFSAVDNIISESYFEDVLPVLKTFDLPISLFYEVRPNLNKEQICALAEAGVRALQPGIESLSTSVLRLIGKGTTFLQNIRFLKWCKQYGIRVHWNFLFGFPGEDASEYDRIAELVPLLTHLDAPDCGMVFLSSEKGRV